MSLLTTSLGRFRLVTFVEGISYLLLLFVAMPLKYLAELPMAVTVVGTAHGALYLAYLAALLHVWTDERWSLRRVAEAFVASLLPFATFWLEAKLRRETPAPAA